MPLRFRPSLPGCRQPQGSPLGVVFLAAALLAGCAEMPAMPNFASPAAAPEPAPMARGPQPVAAPGTAAPAGDALAGFVASAAPGASAEVPGFGTVRLARRYTAASGRECRELLTGRGVEERAVVYCRAGQGWAPARPLLRGGTSRP